MKRPAMTAVLLAGLISSGPACAFEGADIGEVMAGAFGRPEIQFIELRTSFCSSPGWAGTTRLTFHDAADHQVGEFVFPVDPPIDCSGPVSLLLGTQAFADLASAPQPDLIMPPLLVPGGGKVCLADGFTSCLSYGASPGRAPALPASGICSLRHNNPVAGISEIFNADFDLLPPAPTNSAGETGTVVIPPRFGDVPPAGSFFPFVEALFNAGVTGGCGGGAFCPAGLVTREQLAVFLLLAKEGPDYSPAACTALQFNDVPCSNPFAPWINELADRGITGGCGGGNFCPGSAVTRAEMAVLLLLAREGFPFNPPACVAPVFDDVPCSDPFAPWVDELAARGITGGCGNGRFCPDAPVRREQMAVFLTTAFGLPVPHAGCQVPVVPDDHGDTIATATPLAAAPAGIVINGHLERPRDVDFFSFPAQAGEVFTFRYDVGNRFPGLIGIVDSDGTILDGTSLPGFLTFTAPHGGTFFFLMRDAANRAVDSYQLFFRGPVGDDHGAGIDEAVALTVNGPSAAGQIERPGDADTFSFEVTAGQTYVVETVGSDPAMDASLALLDSAGSLLRTVNLRIGPREALAFPAPASGRFFVRVTHGANGAGAYEIRVRGPVLDDHGDTLETATPLVAGTPAQGEILPGDPDLFSFSGAAEQAFFLDFENLGGANYELSMLDSTGALLQLNQEAEPRRTLFLPTTGTYFVRVRRRFGGEVTGYRLTLTGPLSDDHGDSPATATVLPPGESTTTVRLDPSGDVDFLAFHAEAGELFLARLSPDPLTSSFLLVSLLGVDGTTELARGTPGSILSFRAPSSGTYFVRVGGFVSPGVYQLFVRGPIDDPGGRPSTARPLVPNAPPLAAAIELPGDVDLYHFDAAAGESFFLQTSGAGVTILDVDGLTGLRSGSAIWFRAPSNGRFFARVEGPQALYSIGLSGPFPDDHGDTPAAATLIAAGGPPATGEIQNEVDVDVFAFDATAGQTLAVETGDLGDGLDTVLDLLAPNGVSVLATDDDGGEAFASRIVFTASATGRYFARVRGFDSTTGSYTISVHNTP